MARRSREARNRQVRDMLSRIPAGFRFHPLDSEIILDYLVPKVRDPSFETLAVDEAEINKFEPWDLARYVATMAAAEWFFYCRKGRKYPTGTRTNRATAGGYWKATGKDKPIFHSNGALVGAKKTLVFYGGRAPTGRKSNWVMHEYRLHAIGLALVDDPLAAEEWAVCKVFRKKGAGDEDDEGLLRTGPAAPAKPPAAVVPIRMNSYEAAMASVDRVASQADCFSFAGTGGVPYNPAMLYPALPMATYVPPSTSSTSTCAAAFDFADVFDDMFDFDAPEEENCDVDLDEYMNF